MQVHSLPRANTPLLQSITLPPQINWQLKHPRFAIPSPSLPGWGQRAFCGTKPTIRAMLFIILHSWVIYLALHTHSPKLCLVLPHCCFPHELCNQSYLLQGWTHSSPKHASLCYSIENLSSNNTMEYLPAFWSRFRMSLRAMDNPLREWDPAWHLTM